jgi:non-ribosomal peptide synthetase component E (peptide arylation enzyme)
MLQTIGELLERNARFHPEREALVCEGRRLSHRQLLERAKRLADGLHRLGLRRRRTARSPSRLRARRRRR